MPIPNPTFPTTTTEQDLMDEFAKTAATVLLERHWDGVDYETFRTVATLCYDFAHAMMEARPEIILP